jgi:hypothetical protein
MPTEKEQPLEGEKHAEVAVTVARIAEGFLGLISVSTTGIAIHSATTNQLADAIYWSIGVALTSLLVVLVAVTERREAHSERAKRPRAWADEAWGAVMAARKG